MHGEGGVEEAVRAVRSTTSESCGREGGVKANIGRLSGRISP